MPVPLSQADACDHEVHQQIFVDTGECFIMAGLGQAISRKGGHPAQGQSHPDVKLHGRCLSAHARLGRGPVSTLQMCMQGVQDV